MGRHLSFIDLERGGFGEILPEVMMNTMFYFRINASIVAFLSNHISFGILMHHFSKFASKF